MNRDDIIRMAREAGWNGIYSKPVMSIRMQEEDFLRFANLVAAAEREECAKVCEGINSAEDYYGERVELICAEAIRERGAP
jgi:hypothetical protein